MSEQKENIISTRVGGLGSSDAYMCYNIGVRGFLTQSDSFRIAVMLGLEQPIQFSNSGTRLGDEVEAQLFEYLKYLHPNIVSNPYYKSESLSKHYGFDIFNHIDYEVEDEKGIKWFENKSVIIDIDDTISHYFYQICWHRMLLDEKAKELGFVGQLMLSHYDTNGFTSVDEMNVEKWNIVPIINDNIKDVIFTIKSGLQVIADAIPTFEYVKQETLDARVLPDEQIALMNDISLVVANIEKQEKIVEEFKTKMYELMTANNIKSIKHDSFSLTVVGETSTNSFDSKTFKVEEPELYKKYIKTSTKKGFLKITNKN